MWPNKLHNLSAESLEGGEEELPPDECVENEVRRAVRWTPLRARGGIPNDPELGIPSTPRNVHGFWSGKDSVGIVSRKEAADSRFSLNRLGAWSPVAEATTFCDVTRCPKRRNTRVSSGGRVVHMKYTLN